MIEYFGAELQLKTVSVERRLISGFAAAHSNIDRVRDIIDPGASAKATQRLAGPADVAVLVGHNSAMLPVGIPQVIEATPAGLYTETYVLKGPAGDNLLAVAKDLLDHGQALGMSIGYKTHDSRRETAAGKTVRRIIDYELREYSFASQQAIANPQALVSAVKARQDEDGAQDDEDEGGQGGTAVSDDGSTAQPKGSHSEMNTLPNSSFLYVEPGDDDEEGKRVPRGKRHFPYKDGEHKIDLPALRDAIARIPQSSLPEEVKTQLHARARRMLAHAEGGKTYDPDQDWTDGAPLTIESLAYRLHDIAEQVDAERKAMAELRQDTRAGQRMTEPARAAARAVLADLRGLLDFADAIDAGTDEQQRIAWHRQQLVHAAF